ncbi:mpv17-like protein isoform X2 [Anneissia japonica]|uniref:mpv17-like protein isoform X2 n=1 Tax=Anneissia japonica TaxID=1529436 RepID=UPI001425A6A7|nr:mpv17-like protein isoform X2 [Anneissia japonica]
MTTVTVLRSFATWTRNAFIKHPVIANSITYCAIFASAEVTQQLVWADRSCSNSSSTSTLGLDIDWRKVRNIATLGLVFNGPAAFTWYRLLDRWFPGTLRKTVFKKTIVDQVIGCPPFVSAFYVGLSILEGKEDKFASLKEKFWSAYLAGFCFWPPAQTINFFFVPSHFRVLYVASAGFVWANILCFINKMFVGL